MKKVRIEDLDCFISDGNYSSKYPKSTEFLNEGIPFIRCNNFKNGSITKDDMYYISKEKHAELLKGHLKTGDILITTRGSLGQVAIVPKEFDDANINAQIVLLRPNPDKINNKYLMCCLKSKAVQKQIYKNKTGTALQQLPVGKLKRIEIRITENIEEQKEIANKIENVNSIIVLKQKQLNSMDELIKSQFVEMFGDPISNSKNIDYMEMPSVCEIIDGDRGKNYPKAEEFFDNEYCLFLNAKNVTSTGFSFDNCMFITKEKDEKLRNGKLQRGDVVLTTRGTVGNLAYYTEEIPFENVRINSGMVILRMKKELVNEIFFIEQFKMQLENIKNKIANGSAQPQLPITKMNGIKVLTPRIELQNKFANFVNQIDKQKFEIQKSLEEMQLLQESLMDKYFGEM